MNVVADTGAIGRVVVGTENGDVLALAGCDLQDQWNQVRFRTMIFALLFGSAGSVEVAQAGVAEPVDLMEPGEHPLNEQFGFAVGIRGMKRIAFFNGGALGRPVKRSRG